VETPIGHALLAGDVHDGAVIRVGLDHDEIAVTCDSPGAGQQRGAEQPQLSSQ
jgi:hypothetical protein